MDNIPNWLVYVVSFVLALNVVGLFLLANNDVEVDVDFSEQNARLDSLEGSVQALVDASEPEPEEDLAPGSFVLSKSEFEEEALEVEALRLAQESVDSRDFRKAAFFALVSEGVDIDSYQDISEVRTLDTDVDENEVEFSVKLYYFLNEDEEETERARLGDFVVVVDDLDFDDDFEDGEVDEDYFGDLEVIRVYD